MKTKTACNPDDSTWMTASPSGTMPAFFIANGSIASLIFIALTHNNSMEPRRITKTIDFLLVAALLAMLQTFNKVFTQLQSKP
jgi:hypothetical protein